MINKEQKASWNNISVGEYLQIEELFNVGGMDDEDIVMNEIQIIYNQNPYSMGLQEFRKCAESVSFLAEKMPKMRVKDTYTLNGKKYRLHKRLDDFRVAQYIDYQFILKQTKGVAAYPQFISIFLVPEGYETYGDGYDVAEVAAAVRDWMSIADADAIAGFFLRKSKAFIRTFLWYTHRSTRKAIKDRESRRKLKKQMKTLIRGVSHLY